MAQKSFGGGGSTYNPVEPKQKTFGQGPGVFDAELDFDFGGFPRLRYVFLFLLAVCATVALLILAGLVFDRVSDINDNKLPTILEELANLEARLDVPTLPAPIPPSTVSKILIGVYGDADPETVDLSSRWDTHGKNVYNSRHTHGGKLTYEVVSNPSVFATGEPTCDFDVGASVTATPAIEDERYIYFPAWNGHIYKWDLVDCEMIWSVDIFVDVYSEDDTVTHGSTLVHARATPNLWRDYLIIGMQIPGDLVILNKDTGEFIKRVRLSDHPYAIITMSGTISNDWLYVGVASREEAASVPDPYPCCSFVGSMHGINLPVELALINDECYTSWDTRMIPDSIDGVDRFSGVAPWGASPAVDERTCTVYIATGNPYNSPAYYQDCVAQEIAEAEAEGRPVEIEETCNSVYAPNVYYNSIVALDCRTGAVKSFLRGDAYDSWNAACLFGGGNCPDLHGPDADYGMAPMLDYMIKCGTCDLNTDPEYMPHSSLTHETTTTVKGLCFDRQLGRLVPTFACPRTPQDDLQDELFAGLSHPPPPTMVRQLDPRAIPVLYIGQKNGMMRAVTAENGILKNLWINSACPGGALAGIHWGATYDDDRIYVSCTNNLRLRWTLPNGTHTNCSGWQSYTKMNGEREWATLNPACFDPTGSVDNPQPGANGRGYTAASSGPPSISDGVVFVTSSDTVMNPSWPTLSPVPGHGGWVYALRASDGKIFWRYETGRSIYGGFSVGKRCVFTGIGYRFLGALGPWTTGTSVLAFCANNV